MKKLVLTCIVLIIAVSVQAGIIWNFDSPSSMPGTITKLGQFYVYSASTEAGKGIGGTNALRVTVPAVTRSWGGGFALTASTPLNLLSPSSTSWLYGSIMATEASPFGVAFEVNDSSGGYQFIPPPGPYTSYAQKFAGTISTTDWQKVTFNLAQFDRYGAGVGTPDLSAITKMSWIFPDNTTGVSGSANLKFYIDNIGASSNETPVELSSFEAISK